MKSTKKNTRISLSSSHEAHVAFGFPTFFRLEPAKRTKHEITDPCEYISVALERHTWQIKNISSAYLT